MDVNENVEGDVVVLQPVGAIDTRSAFDLERKLDELLGGGSRLLVIDFSEVGLLASSGIRVLLMLAKRLDAVDGSLAFCSLTEHVKTVLDISGLTAQFSIAATREGALSILNSPDVGAPVESAGDPAPAPPEDIALSKISSTTLRLLGAVDDPPVSRRPARQEQDAGSGLTQEVERLVSASGSGHAEADDS